MMTLRVAIQADHPETWNVPTDTTLLLALEAQARGHMLYFYEPKHLALSEQGDITTLAHPAQFFADAKKCFVLGEPRTLNLREMDVVLLRQDPPFDMAYITTTFILEKLGSHTRVFNNPASVRNLPEKLFPLQFAEFMPPTLITADREAIAAFQAIHEDIVIKPLYGYAGTAVFHLKPGDGNLRALFDLYFAHSTEPLIAQKFLPEVKTGDRRIILIEGEFAAIMGRIPAEGEHRANFRVGGTAVKAECTPRQKAICDAVGPVLKKEGILIAGLDCIGDYLTEINITSPTAFPGINRLYTMKLEAHVWDTIEKNG